MIFTPADAALLVQRNGGTDDEAVFLASVMPGESGGDPAIINTSGYCGVNLRAVGLFQICEYPERGTRAELQDPDFNARAALDILRTQGRAAWSATADPNAAEEARQALAGQEQPMEGWHPRANRAPAASGGSSYIGVPWKLVIHTIEAPAGTLYSYNPGNYYGHQSWPQATIDSAGIHQHRPITESGSALYNAAGGVETNRANAIQCEVMGQAAHIGDLPDATWRHLADWLTWCAEQTGTPVVFAAFNGDGAYGENAPQRFGGQEWLDFAGICGHQHVPENCVSADAPMLGADLRWRPAGEFVEGDELLAFDESLVEVGSTGGRRFRRSTVERNQLFKAPAVRVITEVGDVVTTLDHPWLARLPYVKHGTRTVWVNSTDLLPDRHEVYFATHPWAVEHSHDAGWLAGVLDADGHVQTNRDAGCWVGFGQVHGPMLDRFVSEMEARGFTIKQFDRGVERGYAAVAGAKQPFTDVRVTGGIWEQLRCLGTLRPHRLDLTKAWEGAVVGKTTRRVKVLAVEKLAEEHLFAGMQTSTRTYIAAGYLMHNTHWDPGALPVDKLAALMGTTSQEDDLTPEQDARLTYTEGLVKGLSEAMGRIEVAIRDTSGGIGAKLDELLSIAKK